MQPGLAPTMLATMNNSTRALVLGASAIFALSTLTACSGSDSEAPSETAAATSAVVFPDSAKYIADMPLPDGGMMTIGIAVDGDHVAAYACDGSSDEAWFFGSTAADGTAIDITSKYLDELDATFDGTDVEGTLVMNDETLEFTAAPVAAPAGMYTAVVDGVRASWVVRPDDTQTGVIFLNSDEASVLQNDSSAQVRERRLARLLGQADPLAVPAGNTTINGRPVTAQIVDGDTRLG
ncbi:MAG: hypothetical protein ACSLE6_14960 [Mycobacterium sp.]